MAKPDLTAERARELLAYDPETGVFRWRVSPCGRAQIGAETGKPGKNPYGRIVIDGRLYLAHRIAWLISFGTWPSGDIDHIDGRPGFNALRNLRDVTCQLNCQNIFRAKSSSKSGLVGAHWSRSGKTFVAQIRYAGKAHHIGSFKTAEAAHAAYIEAKRKFHPAGNL